MIVCVNPKAEDYEESLVISVYLSYTVGFSRENSYLDVNKWHFVDFYRVNECADEYGSAICKDIVRKGRQACFYRLCFVFSASHEIC